MSPWCRRSRTPSRQSGRRCARSIAWTAGKRRAGQRDQQFLAPDLGRVVVQRRQYAVDQADPVTGAPALDDAGSSRRIRGARDTGSRPARHQRRGDQREQTHGVDRAAADQFQVGQDPGRGVGQDRQRGDTAARGRRRDPRSRKPAVVPAPAPASVRVTVPVRGQAQGQPVPSPEPHQHGPGGPGPPLGAEQDRRLGGPAVDGAEPLGRHLAGEVRGHSGIVRRDGTRPRPGTARRGHPVRPCSDAQLTGPARVPQVTVQVQPEPPVRAGMRMVRTPVPGRVPQGEADALTGIRPGGSGPHHQLHRTPTAPPRHAVPGEGDGQGRPQQPVGSDSRHVPAQQVRSQLTQVRPDPGGELSAMGTCHGTQIEVDVEAGGGTGPGPVTAEAAGGGGLDHGGRHGELAHAQPEGKPGIPVRGVSGHQHSPCADEAPNLLSE